MKILGILALIILGVFTLVAVAVCIACTIVVGRISKEEERQIRDQIEDDRLSCGLIEED